MNLKNKDEKMNREVASNPDMVAWFVIDEAMWDVVTPLFFKKWEELKPPSS